MSGGKPRPRKDSTDSVMIAAAIPSVAATRTGDRTLGRMWRHMIRCVGVPSETAASTYGSSRIDSTTDEEVHTWIQQIPEVREWLGDRHFAALSEASHRLKNRHFERSVAVNKNRLHDRRISVEAPLMRSLGRAFRKFPDRAIASELLIGYASRKCWDGLSFFNDTHYVDPLNTAAPAAPVTALAQSTDLGNADADSLNR